MKRFVFCLLALPGILGFSVTQLGAQSFFSIGMNVASSLPPAKQLIPYTAALNIRGGAPNLDGSYNCVVSSGSLPAGLTLSTGCSFSGTPTAAVQASFTITITDHIGQVLLV